MKIGSLLLLAISLSACLQNNPTSITIGVIDYVKSKQPSEVAIEVKPDFEKKIKVDGMTHYELFLKDSIGRELNLGKDSSLIEELLVLLQQEQYAWQANIILYLLTKQNAVKLKKYAPNQHKKWLRERQKTALQYWQYYIEKKLFNIENPHLTLVDTSINTYQWKVNYYSDGWLKIEIKEGGESYKDSLEYDFFSEEMLINGHQHLIQEQEGKIIEKNAHFINDSTLFLSLINLMNRVDYCYIKKEGKKIRLAKPAVSRSYLSGILNHNKLIIPRQQESLNDTVYVRYFYEYILNDNFLLEKEPENKRYSILNKQKHPLFYKYDTQSLIDLWKELKS